MQWAIQYSSGMKQKKLIFLVSFNSYFMETHMRLQISCGEAFSVALDEQGFLYTTGSSEYGQLGNGSTGERILTANKLSFDNCYSFQIRSEFTHIPGEKSYGAANANEKVVELQEDIRLCHISCGKYHTVAVEAPSEHHTPRVFSWGCGNYGCLGHGIQADEYKPRSIAAMAVGNQWFANPPVSCATGASCSMVLTSSGQIYYWGKHKMVAEAVMRPQVLSELANNQYVADLVAAGHQTVVIATKKDVIVAWGNGPYGELGYGNKKSSSKPDFVASLSRCRIQDLACGFGATYYIVKNNEKSDQDAIKDLPVVSDDAYLELERFLDTVTEDKKK
jgi:alpha-tubulin suppressor-like RCC1 family protein